MINSQNEFPGYKGLLKRRCAKEMHLSIDKFNSFLILNYAQQIHQKNLDTKLEFNKISPKSTNAHVHLLHSKFTLGTHALGSGWALPTPPHQPNSRALPPSEWQGR